MMSIFTLIITSLIAGIILIIKGIFEHYKYGYYSIYNTTMLVIAIISFIIAIHINIPYIYSDGIKTGTIVKVTTKGIVNKTYEGTLILGGMGNTPTIWKFSIPNKEIYDEVSKHNGKKVSLAYKEYLSVPIYKGNTNYMIESLKKDD